MSISWTIFKFDRLWTLDIGTISKFLFDIEYDIVWQYRDVRISIHYYRRYYVTSKNFDVVQDIGAIAGCKDIDVFPSISKIWSISGTICHPGAAAGRTGRVPAPGPGPAGPGRRLGRWVQSPGPRPLDGLYSCVTVLTPFPAGVQQMLSVAAVAGPWCGLPRPGPAAAGESRWAVQVIVVLVIW
jgi:hypothetical protein